MNFTVTEKRAKTKTITSVGALSAIAAVLMQVLEFPIPFMPPFLKFDFSNIPALIGGFAYGPAVGVTVALVKALLHLLVTTTGGVGELADFLTSASMVLTASLIYKHMRTRKNALWGMAAGTIVMSAVGAVTNYFILIPFYEKVMPMEQIIAACAAVNRAISGMATYILFGVLPFNLIKCVLISAITMMIYKKISRLIK